MPKYNITASISGTIRATIDAPNLDAAQEWYDRSRTPKDFDSFGLHWELISITDPNSKTADAAEFDNRQAFSEGWGLFSVAGDQDALYIQRLDVPCDAGFHPSPSPVFESDGEAVAHVRRQAAAGSAYHLDAIRRVDG